MTVINIHEAKTNLSRILEKVVAGSEVIIAKRGKPIAKLIAIDPPKARVPGILKGAVEDEFFEPLPEEELNAWNQ